MNKVYIIIFSIVLVVILTSIFIILWRINKNTPVPKGTRKLLKDEFSCSHCNEKECEFYIDRKDKEEDK